MSRDATSKFVRVVQDDLKGRDNRKEKQNSQKSEQKNHLAWPEIGL